MEATVVFGVIVAIGVLATGLSWWMPRLARRGLLFGVYVGEAAAEGDAARAIRRGYDLGVLLVGAAATLGSLALFAAVKHPLAALPSLIVPSLATQAVYLRAYFAARKLGLSKTPPAVASLVPDPPGSLRLPLAALIVSLAIGAAMLAYTAWQYDALPARYPTHFGPSGRPDHYAARSAGAVYGMPAAALVLTLMVGGSACLTARAKRALRRDDSGISLEAQLRFRRALVRVLSALTVVLAVQLAVLHWGALQVALGRMPGLSYWLLLPLLGMVIVAPSLVLVVARRYGQGGSRLERPVESAPLTNGLADNRHWYLGTIYVNREDPSYLVEHRFGIGYTLNFGNPRAVALLVTVFGALLAVMVWVVLASR